MHTHTQASEVNMEQPVEVIVFSHTYDEHVHEIYYNDPPLYVSRETVDYATREGRQHVAATAKNALALGYMCIISPILQTTQVYRDGHQQTLFTPHYGAGWADTRG